MLKAHFHFHKWKWLVEAQWNIPLCLLLQGFDIKHIQADQGGHGCWKWQSLGPQRTIDDSIQEQYGYGSYPHHQFQSVLEVRALLSCFVIQLLDQLEKEIKCPICSYAL